MTLVGASTGTYAAGLADLVVTKTASRQTASVGQPLIYTVTVRNHGPDTTTRVTLTDFFKVNHGVAPEAPRNYRFLWVQTTQGDCDRRDAEGNVTCRLGDLTSGKTVTVRIGVIPLEPGTIENTARAY